MAKLRRKIYITDEISLETFEKFSRRLTILEEQAKSYVDIELFSHGGEAYAALAFSSRMRRSPLSLHITAHGVVASAAVLVLAAGDVRKMGAEAWVMVHEDSGKISGSATGLKLEASQMMAMEDQWAALLAMRTKASIATWRDMHKQTRYLTADECLAMGLIEEIV